MNQDTLVVFHRCGGKTLNYPPNTLIAAKWARDFGAQAIEYDVAVAKDGKLLRYLPSNQKYLKTLD